MLAVALPTLTLEPKSFRKKDTSPEASACDRQEATVASILP